MQDAVQPTDRASTPADRASSALPYDAFISYSHAVDGELAPALQSGLQRFAKPWYRMRALRVFRDESALSANPHLWTSIVAALDGSRFYILMASPRAAQSEWVDREAAYWREHKSAETLLIALTEGELAWDEQRGDFDEGATDAIPPALYGAFREEPRYIDLRWARQAEHLSLTHPRFRDAVAELAAPLHGQAKDEIAGEEVRQHRRTIRLARAGVAALVVLTMLAIVAGVVAFVQRGRALDQRQVATSRALAAESLLHGTSDPQLGLLLAIEAAKTSRTPEALDALRAALPSQRQLASLTTAGPTSGAGSWSPDSHLVAVPGGDGSVRVYDARTHRPVHVFRGHRTGVSGAVFSRSGREILSWAQDSTARVWRLDGRAPTVLRDRADYRLQAASLSPDGRIVATANFVLAPPRLWDAATGRLLHDLGPANATDDIQFSPDGRTVATCDQNGRAQLWSTSGRLLRTVAASGPSSEGGGRYVWKVRFSPDGTRLLTADGDGTARVFSVASGRQVSLLAGQSRDVHAIAWSPNGRLVLTGSDDHTARLWTVAAHSYTRFDLPAAVEDVEFSRDGSRIVIGAADGTVRVYDTATGSQLYGLDGHTSAIGSASFSPDGRQLLTVAGDGTARLWDVAPVRPRQAPVIHVAEFESQLGQDRARPPAPLDRRLALQQLDRLRVYDPRTRRTTARLPRLRKGDYEGAVFDRAGRVMLVLRSGGRGYLPVQLRRADGGRLLRTLAGPGSQASIGAMTPDGSLVAAADQQGRVGVWDAASGRRLTTFRGHATGLRPTAGQSVAGLAFSDDGRLILSADTLGRDFVWDPHTGRLLNRIRGPAIPPRYLPEIGGTFSPDDRLVAAVWPWDAAVHLYAVGVRGEQAELRAPIVGVFDAAFNQDGSLLATVGQGVAIWDVRQRQLLTTIPLGQDDFRYRVQFTADGTAVATNAASASVSEVIPSEVYPCVVCGSADRLLALARPRVTRRLKAAERAAYLPG